MTAPYFDRPWPFWRVDEEVVPDELRKAPREPSPELDRVRRARRRWLAESGRLTEVEVARLRSGRVPPDVTPSEVVELLMLVEGR
jgi:hypothetical protein